MVVSTQSSAVTYLGNGTTTEWPYNFPIADAAWLEVKTKDPTGVLSVLGSADYDVTGIGAADGGSVIYPKSGTPLPSGWRLRIQRVVPIVQPIEIVNQEGYYPEVLEASADYRAFVEQQLYQRIKDNEDGDSWA